MVVVTVTAALPEHCALLAPLLRAPDLAECIASGFADGLSALQASLEHSVEAVSVFFDGEIVAMVGVDPLGPGQTLIWALTGRAVDQAKLTFLRWSHAVVDDFHEAFGTLTNLVDARYQGAIDWLECLGFRIGEVLEHPLTGLPFRPAVLGGV